MGNSLSIWKFIFTSLKSFRFWIFLQLALGIIWAFDVNLRPHLLKIIIEKIHDFSGEGAISLLIIPSILYIGLALIDVIIFRLCDFIWIKLNGPLKRCIGNAITSRMMEHSPNFFQEKYVGTLVGEIKDVIRGISHLVKILINHFFSHSIVLIIAFISIWEAGPKFSFALLAWVVCFISGSVFLSPKAISLSESCDEVRATAMRGIADTLSNMLSVRLFRRRPFECSQIDTSLNHYSQASQKRDRYLLWLFTYQGLSFVIYQGACLVWLIYDLEEGLVTIGHFALIITLNIEIMECLWRILESCGDFFELLGSIKVGLRSALSPLETQDKPNAIPLKVSNGTIILEKIEFQDKRRGKLSIDQAITIKPCQKIGLVGYCQSGKSILIDLILRAYDPQSGRILVDGQDIKNVTQDSLYQSLNFIGKDPFLFHRTLKENIRYGCLEASDEDVINASKRAYADLFIEKLPERYDSVVGEGGVKLSETQRQSISIARAILKNAPILILEEAIHQGNLLTENEDQALLSKLMQGKTTIVDIHRVSTLLQMDRILVFDGGGIIQDGSHEQLLAQKDGLYKILWDTQVEGFLPDYPR